MHTYLSHRGIKYLHYFSLSIYWNVSCKNTVPLFFLPYLYTSTKPCSHTSQVPPECSEHTAAIFIPINAVCSIYFAIARNLLQLLSCFSLEAYNLSLTCTIQTTTAIPYTGTDSSAFGFPTISCSNGYPAAARTEFR